MPPSREALHNGDVFYILDSYCDRWDIALVEASSGGNNDWGVSLGFPRWRPLRRAQRQLHPRLAQSEGRT